MKNAAVSQLAGEPKKKFLRMHVVDGRVSMEAVEELIAHIKAFKMRAEAKISKQADVIHAAKRVSKCKAKGCPKCLKGLKLALSALGESKGVIFWTASSRKHFSGSLPANNLKGG